MDKVFSSYSLNLYTDIVFGKNTELQAGTLVKKHGGSKVMLVYGGGSIKRMGLYDRVIASLNELEIPFVELSGVQPNPRRSLVAKGVELAKSEQVDFVLAIGGGSTLDTAKAIAFAVRYEGDWWELFSKRVQGTKRLGIGSIHTISAAGSETSTSMVIVDDVDTGCKHGGGGPLARPDFAIMNPELTYSVSKYQTGAGTADILAHTLDRYFVNSACALGDEFAEGLMRTVIKYGPIAVEHPDNYEARAELMLCGSFSHNDITGIGHSDMRGGSHAMESIISSLFDTAHGAGLAVIMPAWLTALVDKDEAACARVAKFAIQVFGVTPGLADLCTTALQGISRFRDWLKSIGMPATLKEMGLNQNDLDTLVNRGGFGGDGNVTGFRSFSREEMRSLFAPLL